MRAWTSAIRSSVRVTREAVVGPAHEAAHDERLVRVVRRQQYDRREAVRVSRAELAAELEAPRFAERHVDDEELGVAVLDASPDIVGRRPYGYRKSRRGEYVAEALH
jgi:hypothetical protein